VNVLPRDSKARWTVAAWLNRLPGMCWAQLVGWVLFDARLRDTAQRYSAGGVNCRADAERCGTCYCGRIDLIGATKRPAAARAAAPTTKENPDA
jgi:hypothetical protein